MSNKEFYISVDVEASGPVPGEYSMLSLGACVVGQPEQAIYLEIQPDSPRHDPEAVAITGFDLKALAATGLTPLEAMQTLTAWIKRVSRYEKKPIFVGLNAPFDWSFVNYYFHKYLRRKPFWIRSTGYQSVLHGGFQSRMEAD